MKSERDCFESKYRFNSDFKYLVFCVANNKYKPNRENEKMHIVQTMADRANSHFETWQAAKTEAQNKECAWCGCTEIGGFEAQEKENAG